MGQQTECIENCYFFFGLKVSPCVLATDSFLLSGMILHLSFSWTLERKLPNWALISDQRPTPTYNKISWNSGSTFTSIKTPCRDSINYDTSTVKGKNG